MAGAQVNDLVRCADHAGLVFDDDYGVARIAQLREQADKAFGVAGMQADARLVEHEERIHQASAKTGGKVHPLGLAARERARRAIQGKIAQADLVEIPQARADLIQNQAEGIIRSQPVAVGERLDERQGVANGKLVEIGQGEPAAAVRRLWFGV